ncbi:DUF397 domain-containing protein [Nocardiopsis sp. MG754419]|uniref:DUF397 domain-containing protein n=1 Tax=Nocardiopsis sp. MG754419 TaxID=2259865 RepID=UPI001BAA43C9|nr:DUF397 domain-containing protein [Nocardiopsis sp. MG754419]MBR8745085.1 DUF397 domain-containing protein [Nocardiopsis sp. MG754419]
MYSSTEEQRLAFRKSSYSNPQNCVEYADAGNGAAAMRDSQNPEQGYLLLNGHEWNALLGVIR